MWALVVLNCCLSIKLPCSLIADGWLTRSARGVDLGVCISEENTCIHMLCVWCPRHLCGDKVSICEIWGWAGGGGCLEGVGLGNYRGIPGAGAMPHMY